MAYTTPKTDWTEAYTPSPQDMNRIEGNTQANREDLSAEIDAVEADLLLEESARIAADEVLDDAVAVETAARIAADATKMNLPSTSTSDPTDLPIGTTLLVRTDITLINRSASIAIYKGFAGEYTTSPMGATMSGTWLSRGQNNYLNQNIILAQRVS